MSRAGKTYRLVWFNQSATGLFLGSYGLNQDFHFSAHTDGKTHLRIPGEPGDPLSFHDIAIEDFQGHKQLVHATWPLNDAWCSPKREFQSDAKTELVILVGDRHFGSYNNLAADLFLLHRNTEEAFLPILQGMARRRANHELLTCALVALDKFPNHKAALALWGSPRAI